MATELGKIAATAGRPALALGLALTLAGLAGCSTFNGLFGGSSGRTQPRGGVVAEEPRAALAGRDILNTGGSAADAAVATYFALSVTMPAVAGLGGGGVCLNWTQGAGAPEVIDFLPRPTAGGNMSVPSNVRGMALLHARSGKLRWEQDVGPAEALARFAQPLSRAAAQGLTLVDPTKIGPNAYQTFTGGSGKMPAEGEALQQIALAAVLARIRAAGAGDFYIGQVAHELVANVGRAFGDLTLEDLRDARPELATPIAVDYRDAHIYLPPAPAAGGAVTADLLKRDVQPSRAGDATAPNLPDAVAPPATGIVVNDFEGNSVACTFTMLSPLGTGQMIANSGIVTAPAPPPAGVISMVPALAASGGRNGRVTAALVATGGGAPSLAAATLAALAAGQPADAVIRAAPDSSGRQNLIACPDGAIERCAYLADPRGAGLGARRSQIVP